MASGDLDVGLVPSVEAVRIPGLRVIPGLCVASTHEVRSVLLVSTQPIEKWRRVVLDVNSRTSASLVRVLLADRYGVTPELVSGPPVLEDMLQHAEAALVIGDPALAIDRSAYSILDLAGEWRALTKRPFVFAMWVVREGVDAVGLEDLFESCLVLGEEELDAVIERASARLGIESATVRTYLTDNLTYRLGADELAGLAEFYRRCHAHHLLDRPGPIRFA